MVAEWLHLEASKVVKNPQFPTAGFCPNPAVGNSSENAFPGGLSEGLKGCAEGSLKASKADPAFRDRISVVFMKNRDSKLTRLVRPEGKRASLELVLYSPREDDELHSDSGPEPHFMKNRSCTDRLVQPEE